MVSAHVFGQLFTRLRQPRVIGEILSGLVLGPTLLLRLFPGTLGWVFPTSGPIPAVLGAVYQLGLLLLMYCSGTEMRSLFGRDDRKTVVAITVGGILVPFLAGLLLVSVIGTGSLQGAGANHGAFVLVFGIAIAVTSIPVISKILFDLGIIGTSFARVVLAAAVVEDVVLYVALAVALGLAQTSHVGLFGVPALLHLAPDSAANVVYHVLAEVGFLVLALVGGPRLFRWTLTFRYNLLMRSNAIAFELAFMLVLSVACVVLGGDPAVRGVRRWDHRRNLIDRERHPGSRGHQALLVRILRPDLLRSGGSPARLSPRLRRAVLRGLPRVRDDG